MPARASDRAASPLRVGSYNVHGCVGVDGCFDPPRIHRVLAQMPVDILALQEVETYHHGDDVLEPYRRRPHGAVICGPTLVRSEGQYGNALITGMPVCEYDLIDLSVGRREARSAIHAQVDHQGARIEILATHLGLRPAERRQQVGALLEVLRRRNAHADLSLLLGDFNEWFLWGGPLRSLQRHFASRKPSPATFPSFWPLFALDRIWVSPPTRLAGTRVLRAAPAAQASDHLPLLAEVWV